MTANDQENIERKLNHVLDMGKRIIVHSGTDPIVLCWSLVAGPKLHKEYR